MPQRDAFAVPKTLRPLGIAEFLKCYKSDHGKFNSLIHTALLLPYRQPLYTGDDYDRPNRNLNRSQ